MSNTKPRGGIEELSSASTPLYGRDAIQAQLTQALEQDDLCVLVIRASGGTGKTVMVRSWLEALPQELEKEPWIMAWRFLDSSGRTTGSSGELFKKLLGLEDRVTEQEQQPPTFSEPRKAKLLEEALLRAPRPAILVLDGLEFLQHQGGQMHGRLDDEAIRLCLVDLAQECTEGNHGLLVVITTREPLEDLRDFLDSTTREIELLALDEEYGAMLLDKLGVIDDEGGADDDVENKGLRAASRDYGGNPLALELLAGIIRSFSENPVISYRHQIRLFQRDHPEIGADWAHAKRLLPYYENKAREREDIILLQMMGLFQRPMLDAERAILLEQAEFATPVRDLTEKGWKACNERLVKLGVLKPSEMPRAVWDCHPLVREYFREQLQQQHTGQWQQAHRELFAYFRTQGVSQPKDKKDFEPLYRSIHHGCLAEAFTEALKVYKERIMLDPAIAFGTNELGAVGQESVALQMFFTPESSELLDGVRRQLNEGEQAFLQARIAFCLTYLGRLQEAIGHRRQELMYYLGRSFDGLAEDERELKMANASAMLSQLYLLAGKLFDARDWAERAIKHANRSGSWDQRARCLCRLGAVLHALGERGAAEESFTQAARLQLENNPTHPQLASDHGFLYRRFLIDRWEGGDDWRFDKLFEDFKQALDQDARDEPRWWKVAISLGRLAKASVMARRARASRRSDDEGTARTLFLEAQESLRDSGSVIDFPVFRLERARFHCWMGHGGEARKDVDKALRYAIDYKMPLYQADAYLLRAEIMLKLSGDGEEIAADIASAEALIQKHDYGNKRGRLEEVKGWQRNRRDGRPRVVCR